MTVTAPTIVITVADPSLHADPELATRKNQLYAAAIERAGGHADLVDATWDATTRASAFAAMDGMLLSGGADVSPERYGGSSSGARGIEDARDALEADAWAAATSRAVPILGICRGLQAINVFSGGSLLQHVDGHAGPGWGLGPAATHRLRLSPGSRLARMLLPTNAAVGGVVTVNSYHHQGVLASNLAPGLVPSAWASSPAGDLVEGLEAADGRFIIGVQCHPERTESTPPPFERLFRVFVDAARGPASRR